MRVVKLVALLSAIFALGLIAVTPAHAEKGNWTCVASPGKGPIGTTFGIACSGFSPNTYINVYAVEPDGRASGLNIYGFFPTSIKTDSAGAASFRFVTEIPGFSSVPAGQYVFVVHELGLGNSVLAEAHIPIWVTGSARPLNGATLWQSGSTQAGENDDIRSFSGYGFAPFEAVNIWVTQPDGAHCSGLGIDQLTLGALAGNASSIWSGPGTVKADAAGSIAFSIDFHSSACAGTYSVSARAPGSGTGASVEIRYQGNVVHATKGAWIMVNPTSVPAYMSHLTIAGYGFPANTGVNCWFTRPDGRVLFFINVNTKTDSSGSFAASAFLDDFPPYTSTDPGWWTVTCAPPNRSAVAMTSFKVYGLMSDP